MRNNEGFYAMFITVIKESSDKRFRRQINFMDIDPDPVDNLDYRKSSIDKSSNNVEPQTPISNNFPSEASSSNEEETTLNESYKDISSGKNEVC